MQLAWRRLRFQIEVEGPLRLEQQPFFELLETKPELARGIIAMLSGRLRGRDGLVGLLEGPLLDTRVELVHVEREVGRGAVHAAAVGRDDDHVVPPNLFLGNEPANGRR